MPILLFFFSSVLPLDRSAKFSFGFCFSFSRDEFVVFWGILPKFGLFGIAARRRDPGSKSEVLGEEMEPKGEDYTEEWRSACQSHLIFRRGPLLLVWNGSNIQLNHCISNYQTNVNRVNRIFTSNVLLSTFLLVLWLLSNKSWMVSLLDAERGVAIWVLKSGVMGFLKGNFETFHHAAVGRIIFCAFSFECTVPTENPFAWIVPRGIIDDDIRDALFVPSSTNKRSKLTNLFGRPWSDDWCLRGYEDERSTVY